MIRGRSVTIGLAGIWLALWVRVCAAWLRAHFLQDVFERTNAAHRLTHVRLKANGVVMAVITPFPKSKVLEWRSAPIRARGMGIPMIFMGKNTAHQYIPGITGQSGTGIAPPESDLGSPVSCSFVVSPWIW